MSNLFVIPFVQVDQQTLEIKQTLTEQDSWTRSYVYGKKEKSSVERQSRYSDESKET